MEINVKHRIGVKDIKWKETKTGLFINIEFDTNTSKDEQPKLHTAKRPLDPLIRRGRGRPSKLEYQGEV
jgi:hypothetical protein